MRLESDNQGRIKDHDYRLAKTLCETAWILSKIIKVPLRLITETEEIDVENEIYHFNTNERQIALDNYNKNLSSIKKKRPLAFVLIILSISGIAYFYNFKEYSSNLQFLILIPFLAAIFILLPRKKA